jgi:hypothetical protein
MTLKYIRTLSEGKRQVALLIYSYYEAK